MDTELIRHTIITEEMLDFKQETLMAGTSENGGKRIIFSSFIDKTGTAQAQIKVFTGKRENLQERLATHNIVTAVSLYNEL